MQEHSQRLTNLPAAVLIISIHSLVSSHKMLQTGFFKPSVMSFSNSYKSLQLWQLRCCYLLAAHLDLNHLQSIIVCRIKASLYLTSLHITSKSLIVDIYW